MPRRQAYHGLKNLIFEDNDVNVFVLGRVLEGWGIEFDVAINGQASMLKAQQKKYDLILMDIRMPVMTGFQATQEIRNLDQPYYRKIPIIALSASTKVGLPDHLGDIAFTDFVGKPFHPEDLFQKIALHCRDVLEIKAHRKPAYAQLTPRIDETSMQFTIARYQEAVGDDTEALKQLLSLIAESYKSAKAEFEKGIRTGDLQKIGNLAHKIRTSTQMLRAEQLEKILEVIKSELGKSSLSDEETEGYVQAVQNELDQLIKLLNAEISRL